MKRYHIEFLSHLSKVDDKLHALVMSQGLILLPLTDNYFRLTPMKIYRKIIGIKKAPNLSAFF